MKKQFKILLILTVLVNCFPIALADETDVKSVEINNISENNQTEPIDLNSIDAVSVVSKQMNFENRIILECDAKLQDQALEFAFDVQQANDYMLGISYRPVDNQITSIKVGLLVDSNFMELKLPRFWTTEEDYQIDGLGNQFAAEQIPYDGIITQYL